MKKTKIIACLTALALGVGGVASADTINMGDVNTDGKVSSLDAAQVLKHDAKLITLKGEPLTAADFNSDGDVNSLDASKILKHDAGIKPKQIDHVENFLDTRLSVMLATAFEYFWYDEEYAYYFANIESHLYVVHYTDGTRENIAQALENGNITIDELKDYGIWYGKEKLIDADVCNSFREYLNFKYYRDNYYGNGVENPDNVAPTFEAALDGRAEITGTLQTEGFVNTKPIEDFEYSDVKELAAKELSETFENGWTEEVYAYEENNYSLDYYVVRFYNESPTVNYKLVYVDKNGITKLIIHDTPNTVKHIEKIVDESEGKDVEPVKEIFYSDANYNYYFETAKSKYVTVYYNDGTTANIKDAFLNSDDSHCVVQFRHLDYKREHKIFSKLFEEFSYDEVNGGAISGETERITEDLVYGKGSKVIVDKEGALAMALRQTDVEYTNYTVYYDGNTNTWCVSFTLADGSYQNVYLHHEGWPHMIINGTTAK